MVTVSNRTAQPTVAARVRTMAEFIARRTGVDAEDLEQEGMLAAWLAERGFDPAKGSLMARQVFKAKTAMLDYRRNVDPIKRVSRGNGVTFTHVQVKYAKLAVPPVAIEAVYILQLLDAVNHAPIKPSYRDALLATTLGDMTQQEYADEIGVHFTRVSQLVALAVNGIRKALIK